MINSKVKDIKISLLPLDSIKKKSDLDVKKTKFNIIDKIKDKNLNEPLSIHMTNNKSS